MPPAELRLARSAGLLNQFIPIAVDWDHDDDIHPWVGGQTYFADGQISDRTNNLALEPFTLDPHFRETCRALATAVR